ncbi:MAG: AMP-binding protein [Acidimicrobiales bacterium]
MPVDPATDVVVLPYSSGTTGLSKGVMLTHRNLVANIVQCDSVLPIAEGEAILAVLPFFHIYGMQVLMNGGLAAGGTVVTVPVRPRAVPAARPGPQDPPGVHRAADRARSGQAPDRRQLRPVVARAALLGRGAARARAGPGGWRPPRVEVKRAMGMTELSPVSHATPQASTSRARLRCPTSSAASSFCHRRGRRRGRRGRAVGPGLMVMAGYLNNV